MPRDEYPIKDYALIGNCETAALINPDGGIDWLCLPAFDSPPVYGALLDRAKGGEFSVRPALPYTVAREYAGDTAILETRFETERGVVRLTDFMVVARQKCARFYDFTSLHPARKLVRLIEVDGEESIPLELKLAARPDYGRGSPHWKRAATHPFRFTSVAANFYTNLPVTEDGRDLTARFAAEPGKSYFAVLDWSDAREPADLETIRSWMEITRAFWNEWNLFNYYRGPRRKLIRRSAVTLKLMTYAPTGAFVAAPTTSLPEIPGGESNWDYRYAWVRDTALFINTFYRLGYSGEATAFLEFIAHRCTSCDGGKTAAQDDAPLVEVLYGIRPESRTDETHLDELAGYQKSQPVRIGNRAAGQFQIDNHAHLLQALLYYEQAGGRLNARKREMIGKLIPDLLRQWSREDNGIWEALEIRHYTSGKVMAWVALRRACDLGLGPRNELERACAELRAEILERGVMRVDGREYLAGSYDSPGVDASVLLAYTSGFLPETLARQTREEIEQRLADGALLYRNSEQREKGEGAFLICSFWWISHLIHEGQLDRAETLLEEIIAHASPLGLFAEEIDPATGEFRGNFPQAFSHLGLIGTILSLEDARRSPKNAALTDDERFRRTARATAGWKGALAGFIRVPQTLLLIFSSRSKWRE